MRLTIAHSMKGVVFVAVAMACVAPIVKAISPEHMSGSAVLAVTLYGLFAIPAAWLVVARLMLRSGRARTLFILSLLSFEVVLMASGVACGGAYVVQRALRVRPTAAQMWQSVIPAVAAYEIMFVFFGWAAFTLLKSLRAAIRGGANDLTRLGTRHG